MKTILRNRIIAVVLLATLLLNASCSKQPVGEAETYNIPHNVKSLPFSKEFYSNHPDKECDFQVNANENITKINEAFSNTHGTQKNETKNYPEFYGGSYVGPNGKMVVLIKGGVIKERRKIVNIIGSDDFITIPCKYSYKTLDEIMDNLNKFKLNKANALKASNFNAYALSEDLNQVTVELDEFSEMKIAQFKKEVMNSPAIVFVKSSGRLVEQ